MTYLGCQDTDGRKRSLTRTPLALPWMSEACHKAGCHVTGPFEEDGIKLSMTCCLFVIPELLASRLDSMISGINVKKHTPRGDVHR